MCLIVSMNTTIFVSITHQSLFIVAVLSGEMKKDSHSDAGHSMEPESSTFQEDMPVERLLEAELAVEPANTQYVDSSVSISPPHLSLSLSLHLFISLSLPLALSPSLYSFVSPPRSLSFTV